MAPYNAANRKDIREAEKLAKLADQQRGEVISNLMDTIPGRMWTVNLLERCHIFSTSFSNDGLKMAFAEGERNVGLIVLMDIMVYCPDKYMLMMRERNERNASRDNSRDYTSGAPGDAPDAAFAEPTGSEDAGRDIEGPSTGSERSIYDDFPTPGADR